MMEEILPKVNKKDGRYGMDFWKIFVLHVVKSGANIILQDKLLNRLLVTPHTMGERFFY